MSVAGYNISMDSELHLGTCSWKFESWRGLVYSDAPHPNYLSEYSRRYDCVEIDQWFWSLFGPGKVALPLPKTVADYAVSVPDGFRFGVKMPNALTLTHYRPKDKTDPLVPNPHFLSMDLLRVFLEDLVPLRPYLGPMMFQFEYLNRNKMSSQEEFQDRLGAFAGQLPKDYCWCVESRNPNYLNGVYFDFLREQGLAHVFEQGYYMPPVNEVFQRHGEMLTETSVIRLHGPDRGKIEERTGKEWNRLAEPRDADLDSVAEVVRGLKKRKRHVWVFANNHFEGSAPLTIERLRQRVEDGGEGGQGAGGRGRSGGVRGAG
jgi:uncharacterized protein YecE (DUF72 family)